MPSPQLRAYIHHICYFHNMLFVIGIGGYNNTYYMSNYFEDIRYVYTEIY